MSGSREVGYEDLWSDMRYYRCGVYKHRFSFKSALGWDCFSKIREDGLYNFLYYKDLAVLDSIIPKL